MTVGRIVAVVGVAALVAFDLADRPPAVHADGGFPAAEVAAARIIRAAGPDALTLRSLPDFKSTEAYGYPFVRAGATVRVDTGSGPVAAHATARSCVICDALFAASIGAPCGGPAEDVVAPPDRFGPPVDRFLAAPGRTISVYRPNAVGGGRRPAPTGNRERRRPRRRPSLSPRPGSWRANPGRALVCASSAPVPDRQSARRIAPC